MLTRTFLKTIETRELIRKNDRLLIGLSGGADSVALFFLLCDIRSKWSLELSAAHLNHRIRGEDSDEDERFVRTLSRRMDVPLVTETGDVRALAARRGCSLEMAAREARYDLFARAARKRKARAVVLAHTMDDQAETLLLRLLRGAGVRGLAGMEEVSIQNGLTVIRPLLDMRHEELIAYLEKRNEPWREDRTNQDVRFLRNRVRHELIPLLGRHFNPRITETLHRTASLLRDEDRWMESAAAPAWEASRIDGGKRLSGKALHAYARPIRYRIIVRWLEEQGLSHGDITHQLVCRIDELLRSSRGTRRVSLADGREAAVRYRCVSIEKPEASQWPSPYRESVPVPGEIVLPEAGLRICTTFDTGYRRSTTRSCGTLPAEGWIDRKSVGRARLYVRSRKAGDRIALPNMRGSRKVQDIFVDEKVPREARNRVPLLECRGEIIWIPGYVVARGWEVRHKRADSIRVHVERI